MNTFAWVLLVATFLHSLMAGFLFAFAVVVMPGLRLLEDREFLRSFQVTDRVIQNNQPLFMAMWLGSTLSLIIAAVVAVVQLDGIDRALVVSAALASVLLVQVPTITINIPLNNTVQALDLDALDSAAAEKAREEFEPKWNRWNVIRTIVASAILAVLLVTLGRL
ncbi:MAG TPA: DUF1772 domain-containing protein [Planctomycetaceae bacterium]|nr:DUF1772 domain-containing protein [Planctomycetaceae bacterium]